MMVYIQQARKFTRHWEFKLYFQWKVIQSTVFLSPEWGPNSLQTTTPSIPFQPSPGRMLGIVVYQNLAVHIFTFLFQVIKKEQNFFQKLALHVCLQVCQSYEVDQIGKLNSRRLELCFIESTILWVCLIFPSSSTPWNLERIQYRQYNSSIVLQYNPIPSSMKAPQFCKYRQVEHMQT